MEAKLNNLLGKKSSERQPKRLPRQASLPSRSQLKSMFLDEESNHYSRVELPFGDPPEDYCLVAMPDRFKGGCQWNLYRGQGNQSALELTLTSNDWEQIHNLICAQFPGLELKARMLSGADQGTSLHKPSAAMENEPGRDSSFARTLEGDLRNWQVPNLLQTISMGKQTGRLQIRSRMDTAQVFFNDGTPVHCQLKGAEGDAAIVQLIGWEEGEFCFFPEPKTDLKTVKKRLDFLIMEGAQFVDQFKSLSSKGLGFDAVVIRVHEALTEAEFEKHLASGTGIDLAAQKRLYVAIDNRSTLFEILRSERLAKTEWVPILFNLVSCGLVEFRHPQTAAAKDNNTVYRGTKVEWSQMHLAEKALTMPETGLFTFPALLYFLDREFCRFERFKRPFSVVVLKIGLLSKGAGGENAASDSVRLQPLPLPAVKDLGKTITRIKRTIDILAHYQTFDYALLLPETGRQAAGNFIDRLSDVLKVTTLQDVGQQTIDFAIGCASLPEDGNNLDTVIALAWSQLASR